MKKHWLLTRSTASLAIIMPVAVFNASGVVALELVNEDKTIDFTVPVKEYQVTRGATLTARGASTGQINLREGARLEADATTIVATDDAVLAEGGTTASIVGSYVSSDRLGVVAARTGDSGSVIEVSSSTVIGAEGAALIATDSELHLTGSVLLSTGAGSAGVRMFNGSLQTQGSQITGAQEGILVNADGRAGQAQIDLDATHVVGQDGAAIVVAGGRLGAASARIDVRNGTSLDASNGNLLEVRNDSQAEFSVDNAQLNGNVWIEEGSSASVALANQATLTGQLENVAQLSVESGARWVMVDDATVGDLRLDGGTVQFGAADAYHRLSLNTLSGNGTFMMDADFSQELTDFLDVSGDASGNHGLLVGSSGDEPDRENSLRVVHTGGGDASFSLVNGPVDLGAFSYELVKRGDDWYLDGSSKIISPGTRTVLAMFNTAPTVWYGELTSLRSRMGELRLDDGKAGAWMRSYGNKYDVAASSGVAYRQTQHGFSIGADAPLPVGDGHWLLGVLAGHSRSDLDLSAGSQGEIDSYYLGLYTTWIDPQSGYYFDGVVKFNRFNNESKVALSDGKRAKGSYDNNGVGASVEVGRHLELADGYFIEPFTQWSAAYIDGKDYRLDNDLQASGEAVRSVLGKAGATAGRNFEFSEGRVVQPYVRAAYTHEFINNNDVKVNNHRFSNDLSGSRLELGAGVAVSLMERLQLHADVEHSRGEQIDQPWGVNVGLRYSW